MLERRGFFGRFVATASGARGPMQTRDLGTKHICFKCSTKFYDLKKPKPVCPKCGADQREAPPELKGGRRPSARPDPVEEEVELEAEETTEDEERDEDDE